MIAAIYCRCSTGVQDVSTQLSDCRAEAVRRGWEVVEYVDEGISGATASRPALDRMRADAHSGRIHAVISHAVDRLGRSLRHALILIDDLLAQDVQIVLLRGGFNPEDPHGMAMLQIGLVFAELERKVIGARIKSALAYKKSIGVQIGRRRAVDVSDETILALKQAEPWLTTRDIARQLGIGKSTVSRTLQRTDT